MTNAWVIKPLPAVAYSVANGTVTAGAASNVGTDYAGVGVTILFGTTGNPASIRIDLGADVPVDTIMAFGVDLAPAGTNLSIYYATAAQGPFTGQYSNDATGKAFAGSSSQQSGTGVSLWSKAAPITARYWQLTFISPTAGQSIRVARVVIGKRIQLARNFVFGAAFGVRDLGSLDFSRRGVLLRSRGTKLRTLAISFENANRDEVTSAIRPLIEQIGNTDMIAVIPDPSGATLTDLPCYYGPLVGDLTATWRTAAAWEWKVNLVSIF